MPQKVIYAGKQNSEYARYRLPEIHLIVKPDLWKRKVFLAVAIVVEEVFEITLEFGYIHHNGIFFQLLKDLDLFILQPNSGIEEFQNQVSEAADVAWKKTSIMIMGVLQEFAGPSGGYPTGLRGLFLF